MYKHIILTICILLLTGAKSFSQTRVTKYCYFEAYYKNGFTTSKFTIKVRLGNIDSLFSFMDTSIISKILKIQEMDTVSDALNYMTNIGWSLVTITSSGGLREFYFKREFDKSDFKN